MKRLNLFIQLKSKKPIINPKDECVRVVIRCRPMEQREIDGKYQQVVGMDSKRGIVSLKKPNDEEIKEFSFDAVYDWK
jgi:hypothetical protein